MKIQTKYTVHFMFNVLRVRHTHILTSWTKQLRKLGYIPNASICNNYTQTHTDHIPSIIIIITLVQLVTSHSIVESCNILRFWNTTPTFIVVWPHLFTILIKDLVSNIYCSDIPQQTIKDLPYLTYPPVDLRGGILCIHTEVV